MLDVIKEHNQHPFSMFTNYPHLRMYFRDAERFNAQKVQESERFKLLGQRILLSMHFLALSFDRPDIIRRGSCFWSSGEIMNGQRGVSRIQKSVILPDRF